MTRARDRDRTGDEQDDAARDHHVPEQQAERHAHALKRLLAAQAVVPELEVAAVLVAPVRRGVVERVEHAVVALVAVVPADRQTAFGSAMILHGRETCVARKPKCPDCVLLKLCQWPEKTPGFK